jgi:CRISPR-associated endonuclease/helicase Cas3
MPDARYAHTRKDKPIEEWQPLEEHLREVARRAEEHARAFESGPWGELAGLWHDLGKYSDDFQKYLKISSADPDVLDGSIVDGKPGRVDHSSAGAVHVYERASRPFQAGAAALAMVIGGHHSGLPERLAFENDRLKNPVKADRLLKAKLGQPPHEILDRGVPALPPLLTGFATGVDRREKLLRFEFWTRMLFSALIDADRLDTEQFQDEGQSARREKFKDDAVGLPVLRELLDAELSRIAQEARAALADGPTAVFEMRVKVLAACRSAAIRPRGRYSLTVPTGGGKTLASLAFALSHALQNDLRRVIVVIPFTSIIDQTAEVYRKIFESCRPSPLIEHHSNLDPARETVQNRLCSENWDAPIIVTTSVQFFESLFTDKGTAARKLHNIAKSVLVFDEVQTLPHELREPIFDGLNQLVDFYGCSALFCTATQPALSLSQVNRQCFPYIKDVDEVIPDVPEVFKAVADRVDVTFPRPEDQTTWEQLAADVKAHPRALVIVHRRDDARDLCKLLTNGAFHLSALMCPAHRKAVLAQINQALKSSSECIVVSTTLIEAGVDLDFPVVYRSLGGIDGCAQAAGRCNRNGVLRDGSGKLIPGRLILFNAPTKPPRGLQLGLDTTQILIRQSGDLELFDPRLYERYFQQYLATIDPGRAITTEREARNFPEVARLFRMIDEDGQATVVVPYGDAGKRVESYRHAKGRETLRALQPFTVNVRLETLWMLDAAGCVETIHEQVKWLTHPQQYDSRFGLKVDEFAPKNPADLIG